jgi:hypothetical protein
MRNPSDTCECSKGKLTTDPEMRLDHDPALKVHVEKGGKHKLLVDLPQAPLALRPRLRSLVRVSAQNVLLVHPQNVAQGLGKQPRNSQFNQFIPPFQIPLQIP